MTNNIRQIYHASHCGSTLMVTLLANSTITYSEPSWSANIGTNEQVLKQLTDTKSVIKFQSSLCHSSGCLPGKKVFLYRKLRHHLFKIKSSNYVNFISSSIYDYCSTKCHKSLEQYEFNSDLEKVAFVWLNNIQWIRDVEDILWIESNEFFNNKQPIMNKVCDHFELNRITSYELANFYVKSFGINGNEHSVNEATIPNLALEKSIYPSYGTIENDMCSYYDDINFILKFVEKEMTFIPKELL